MSKTIEFKPSKMQVKFRVYGKINGEKKMLFSSDHYSSAEEFCWRYNGPCFEIRIDKYWVKK